LQTQVPMGDQDARVAQLISGDVANSVSVHVRRGDYLSGVHAQHHGLCDESYYAQAFKEIRRTIERPRFFIFSDDPEWVESRQDLFNGAVIVGHNRSESAFQDLRLMSLCRGHVMANSSFSWWAAWLCNTKDKRVISPARWLRDGRPTPSLLPSTWVQL